MKAICAGLTQIEKIETYLVYTDDCAGKIILHFQH